MGGCLTYTEVILSVINQLKEACHTTLFKLDEKDV